MSQQVSDLSTVAGVPNPYRPVFAPGCDAAAIRRKDRHLDIVVVLELEQLLAGRRVPNSGRSPTQSLFACRPGKRRHLSTAFRC